MTNLNTPKTWATDEILTAGDLNDHLRDAVRFLLETAYFQGSAAVAQGGTMPYYHIFVGTATPTAYRQYDLWLDTS